MVIQRSLARHLRKLAKKFPLVGIVGPRQSGKTFLSRLLFPSYAYVSLEDLDVLAFAQDDPRGFLRTYPDKVIIDEAQNAPALFSYLQTHTDLAGSPGQYVLTGSQNFLLHSRISQSLSGRIALVTLPPLTMRELKEAGLARETYPDYILSGFYPRVYAGKIPPSDWYPQYTQTFLERDVRQLSRLADLIPFKNFLRLCAGRVGQLLNLSSLAVDAGVSPNTARAWLSVLEASFITFRIHPYFNNFNKRLIKSPKLYFYDSGLVAHLLGIETPSHILAHPLKGELFENLVVSELYKEQLNRGRSPSLYFWRTRGGREIDLVALKGGTLFGVEIKSGETINSSFFDNLQYWQELPTPHRKRSYLVYGGGSNQRRKVGTVLGWDSLETLARQL